MPRFGEYLFSVKECPNQYHPVEVFADRRCGLCGYER